MPEKDNPNSLNDDCFNISEDDHACHYLVDAAARISRAFLAKPDLDSDTLKGLQTAISALQRFPSVTPGVSVECSFSARVGDQKAEQMRYWGFSIFESEFEASSGGSVYTQEVGGDSYTDFGFYIGKSGGRSCDGNPFHWVKELENASASLELEVSATDESQYEAIVAQDSGAGPAGVGEVQNMGPDQQLLRLSRATFQESLRRLQRAGKKSRAPVRLEWDDGELVVGWSDSVERMPAQGSWPQPVYVSAVWLRVLARSLPNADPLTLQVRDGRLYAENFSRPCVDPEAPVAELKLPPEERDRRLKKAAAILKPFRVREADIEALVNRCEPEGVGAHPPEEDRMLKRLAEAWALLALFGVGTEDIYEMVQQRIRLAWKEGGLQAED